MANSAIATPTLLTDPGFLYWAPLGSALPTPASTASAFTDTWPVAWVPLGMTDAGTEFDVTTTVQPIAAAEQIDPIAYRTTDRTGSITFALKSLTATNLARCFNGATTSVTGTGGSTITKIDPPDPGQETRCMIGFESLDSTFRFIAYQCVNATDVKMVFAKAPKNTNIDFKLMLEKPASTQPWSMWTAGTARA